MLQQLMQQAGGTPLQSQTPAPAAGGYQAPDLQALAKEHQRLSHLRELFLSVYKGAQKAANGKSY